MAHVVQTAIYRMFCECNFLYINDPAPLRWSASCPIMPSLHCNSEIVNRFITRVHRTLWANVSHVMEMTKYSTSIPQVILGRNKRVKLNRVSGPRVPKQRVHRLRVCSRIPFCHWCNHESHIHIRALKFFICYQISFFVFSLSGPMSTVSTWYLGQPLSSSELHQPYRLGLPRLRPLQLFDKLFLPLWLGNEIWSNNFIAYIFTYFY